MALDPLGHREKGEVELVDAEHLGKLLARLLADGQLDPGMALVEDREGKRHVNRAHRVHRADGHVSGLQAAQPLQLAVRCIDLGENPPGAGDEQLAGVGQGNASCRALDEGESDFVLEAANLLREGRLRDVLARGRPREMPLLGEGQQVTQLTQFHKRSLYIGARTRL